MTIPLEAEPPTRHPNNEARLVDKDSELLVDEVLAWWQEHEFDNQSDDGECDFDIYTAEPNFVTIANQLKNKQ